MNEMWDSQMHKRCANNKEKKYSIKKINSALYSNILYVYDGLSKYFIYIATFKWRFRNKDKNQI